MCLLIILTVGALVIMSYLQASVLCDLISRRRKFINTFFHYILTFQWHTDWKRKIMKDEKKHHGAVNESSVEQHFHKSDTITFVV